MKRFVSLFLLITFILLFSCQETKKKVVNVEKKQNERKIEIIKRTESLRPIDDIKDVVKKNRELLKLYESLKQDSYSIDELIDLTKNDLEIFKQFKIRKLKSKIDTPAVKSRLILTEINLKKLNFLLHKKKIEVDTIRKTLNEVTRNINATLDKISLYNQSIDEFENILIKDSLVQAKKDSMPVAKQKVLKKLKFQKLKNLKLNIKSRH